MDRTFSSLDVSNVDEFFSRFVLFVEPKIIQTDLFLFLSGKINDAQVCFPINDFFLEQFPQFKLRLTKDNNIEENDYVFVYSLLFYYSCVKYPDRNMQELCKKLPTKLQQCVAEFFTSLQNSSQFDKETLIRIIIDTSNFLI